MSQRAVQKTRRNQIHNQRFQLLQLDPDHERRGRRGYRAREHQRYEDRVAGLEPQLGAKLAIQRRLGGAGLIA